MRFFEAGTAYAAMGKILWGILFCGFDFWIGAQAGGHGLRVDILNDVLGTILVAWGLAELRPLVADERYANILQFCLLIALLAIVEAVLDHFVVPWPPLCAAISELFSMAVLVAIFQFCTALRMLCQFAHLLEAEQSWRFSQSLFFVLQLLPLMSLHVGGLVLSLLGRTAHFESP